MSGHGQKEYTIPQIALNLFMACMVSGIIISGIYYFTAPIAAQKAEEMKVEAMKELIADADDFKEISGHKEWFEAKKGEETLGYVVPGEAKGFGGAILMLVAVSPDGKVIDYAILKHNETPGLGDVAAVSPFKDQFKGKTVDKLVVVKDPTNKENIIALTGATITSKAVTEGVVEAVDHVMEVFPAK